VERALLTEEDLNAFIDDELAVERHWLVERHLREHPDDAQRLAAYRADGEAIARIFARVGDLPTTSFAPARQPAALKAWDRTLNARWAATPISWQHAAAIALIVAGALVAGFLGLRHGRSDDAMFAQFGAEAMTAHLSLTDGRSQPAMAASLQEVSDYLSAKLKKNMALRNPTASGYSLVSSKFIASAKGRVAQLAFRNADGEFVTMYMEPWPGKDDTPFREVASHDRVVTMVWTDDEITCAVSGSLPADRLEQTARAIYDALIG